MNARERRAAELAAGATRQAELKQEAAERRAARQAKEAGEAQSPAAARQRPHDAEPDSDESNAG
jgi:hypothetical protein